MDNPDNQDSQNKQGDRVYQQDVVPFIRLRQPILQASSNVLITDPYLSSILLDLNASNIHKIVLKGNPTLSLKNVSIGQSFTLRLVQDTTGTRTVTWFSTIHWPAATPPTLTTTASHWDVFEFLCTAEDQFDGYIKGANLS